MRLPADQRRQISALVDSGSVHGLVVGPETAGRDGAAILTWLEELAIPVVLVERRAVLPQPLAARQPVAEYGGAQIVGDDRGGRPAVPARCRIQDALSIQAMAPFAGLAIKNLG